MLGNSDAFFLFPESNVSMNLEIAGIFLIKVASE